MTSSSAGRTAFLTDSGPELNSELPQLFLLHFGRRAAHRVDARLVLRECDHVAEIRLLREHHHHPVDPEGDPAVRRRAHGQRVEKEAELRPLLLRRKLEDGENARLDVGLVDPEGPATELLPVADEVVGMGQSVRGVGIERLLEARSRPRERMVDGRPAIVLLRPLEHREVGDPNPIPGLLVDQPELAAEVEPQRTKHARDHDRLVGGEENAVARIAAEVRELLLGEELGDRRTHLALLVPHEVREPLGTPLLRHLLEALELAAGESLRHADEAHGRRAREDAELRIAGDLGRLLELEPEPKVRLVRAEARVGFRPGEPWERRLELHVEAVSPGGLDHLLHEREEELLVRKGHLDVELSDLLHPVGAQVLVAEAARDLEVAVEAADHEELLEDLGGLWECEEPAGLKTARDDEVARALRRRLEEDRRLDLEEAAALHRPPDRRDHRAAKADVALHPRAAQIEPTVAETQRLVDVLLVELEGQRRRGGDDLQGVDLELDLAGGDVRVDRLGRTRDDLSLRAEHELVPDRVAGLRGFGRALGVEHELADAGPVTEIDEDERAVVPTRIGPASQGESPADVLGPHLAAHQIAPGHAVPSDRLVSASTTTTRSAPRRLACVRWPLTERPAKSASARTPAARSSAILARTAVRSAPSSQMKKTSTPSSAGGSTPPSSSARRSRSMPAPNPTPGGCGPPSSSARPS